jgi:hypothetical protein
MTTNNATKIPAEPNQLHGASATMGVPAYYQSEAERCRELAAKSPVPDMAFSGVKLLSST